MRNNNEYFSNGASFQTKLKGAPEVHVLPDSSCNVLIQPIQCTLSKM